MPKRPSCPSRPGSQHHAARPHRARRRGVARHRSSSTCSCTWSSAPELLDAGQRARPGADRQDDQRARREGHQLRAAEQRHRARRRRTTRRRRRASRSPAPGLLGNTQPGFELFDKQSSATSNFQQQVTYQRALRGPARRDDRQVQGVSGAQVQLVLPDTQSQLFADRPERRPPPPCCCRARRALDPARCAASPSSSPRACPGLQLEQGHDHRRLGPAAVADRDGRRRRRRRAARQAGSRGALRPAMAASLQAMLAQTLGPGKAQVQVYADMNVDQTTKEQLDYGKKGVAAAADASRLETLEGGGSGGGGAPAPAQHCPPTRRRGAAASRTTSTKSTNAHDRRRQDRHAHRRSRPAPSTSQHVSVLLDQLGARLGDPRDQGSGRRTPPASTPSAATRSRSARSPSPRPPRRPRRPRRRRSVGYAKYVAAGDRRARASCSSPPARCAGASRRRSPASRAGCARSRRRVRLAELERELAARPTELTQRAPGYARRASSARRAAAGRAARRQRPRPRRAAGARLDARRTSSGRDATRREPSVAAGRRAGARPTALTAQLRSASPRVAGAPQGRRAAGRARLRARRERAAAPARGGDRERSRWRWRSCARSAPTRPTRSSSELAAVVQRVRARCAAGGIDFAREVLERALGLRARGRDASAASSTVIETRPFEFLRRTPAEQIVDVPAQRVAADDRAGVANLHTTLAAQVLAQPARGAAGRHRAADRAHGRDAARRRSSRSSTCMRQQARDASSQQEYAAAGGVKSLAEILNHADRPTERNVLENLAEHGQRAGRGGPRGCCSSSRTSSSSTSAPIQQVLREVDQKDLALALRGVARGGQGASCWRTCPSAARRCSRRRWRSSRRSASASSTRRRAASSASCAGSRKPARS